ncbi:MAG: TolC family protein [Rhizobiaceae bacterium]|nr:TolC family protein [Rhizobiaceae bacterium]
MSTKLARSNCISGTAETSDHSAGRRTAKITTAAAIRRRGLTKGVCNAISLAMVAGALSACSLQGQQAKPNEAIVSGPLPPPVAPGQAQPVLADAATIEAPATNKAPETASPVETVQVSLNGLNLQEAVGLAIARHPDITRSEAIVAQSESEVAIAKSAWFPTLDYEVSPGYTGSSSDQASVGIGVTQLVYDFGRSRSNIAAANATLGQQRHLLADTIESVAFSTASTFIDLAASQDMITAAERQVDSLRDINKKIETRVKAGLSDASDLNQAEVAIQRAAAEVLSARMEFDIAAGKLAQVAGVRPTRVRGLGETSTYIRKLGGDMQDSIENTPSVLAAQAAVDAATARVKLAKAERFPSIGVNAGQSLSTEKDIYGDYSKNSWVGLKLIGDISTGGLNKNKIRAAEAEQRAQSQALENQRLVTRTALGSAETEAAGAESRLQSYDTVIGLSRNLIDLYWQQYTLNKRPLTDVINAERDIYQSEAARITAIADGDRARVRANSAVGRFVAALKENKSAE